MLISGVNSVIELRSSLDAEITENEVYAGQIERELVKLGEQIDEQKNEIRAGQLSDRLKLNALRNIKRLNTRVQSYERRLQILQENIDLHFQVLNQIDEMEAMEMKAIKREQIDEIAVDYEERLEKHRDLVNAVRASVPDTEYEDVLEKQELAALEAEIMGINANKAQEKKPVSKEPAGKEPAQNSKTKSPEPKSLERRRPSLDEEFEAALADVELDGDLDDGDLDREAELE